MKVLPTSLYELNKIIIIVNINKIMSLIKKRNKNMSPWNMGNLLELPDGTVKYGQPCTIPLERKSNS